MSRRTGRLLAAGLVTVLVGWGVFRVPEVRDATEWRLDAAMGILRGLIYPSEMLPTPAGAAGLPAPVRPTPHPPTPSVQHTAAPPTPSATPLPSVVQLQAPAWEKQDWNNCGPATLALGLRFFGWDGDQFDISELLKPDRGDKNVNIDELVYYVRTRAGWMEADYRVGGTIETLKRFLAYGLPVIVEKGYMVESDGPDEGWAGHYLLLTGYDDARRVFVGQDTFAGPDQEVAYEVLDEGWKAFNRAYLFLYPVTDPPPLESLLQEDLDADLNRQRALETAWEETALEPKDAFAWFNVGTNLVYFERYREAAEAYDRALALGLPWRFTRYQFGPYLAYFHSGRLEDVIELANATLRRTAKAEESLLWRGWARYRQGDVSGAREDFLAALRVNPNYQDARYALDFISGGS
ncbi:MAG TPA: tetratricopeptide repeat protein [Chloroflexi bacterium]|nr:tetratricopeptide repeat protein [Chloroflexota bacterium]